MDRKGHDSSFRGCIERSRATHWRWQLQREERGLSCRGTASARKRKGSSLFYGAHPSIPTALWKIMRRKAGTLVKSATALQLELIRRVVIGEKPPRPALQGCMVGVLCCIGSAADTRWWEGATRHVFIFAMQSHWEVWFVKALARSMALPVHDGVTPAERLEVGNLWYPFCASRSSPIPTTSLRMCSRVCAFTLLGTFGWLVPLLATGSWLAMSPVDKPNGRSP